MYIYDICDRLNGMLIVATCKTRNGAHRSADKRDNAYGAYRFSVVARYMGPAL
jgi:hypothetical protein